MLREGLRRARRANRAAMGQAVELLIPQREHFRGDLLHALGGRPTVFRFKRGGLEKQLFAPSRHEVVWLSHTVIIYKRNCRLSRDVKKGRRNDSHAFGEQGDGAAEVGSFGPEWFERAAAVRG